jgi:hypothetical protein
MSFLFPGFLVAAGLVSAAVVVLHFLVTQQPRSEDLPTVRFVPDVPARSTSVAIKPSDLLLLLVRVLTIMAIGAAFAQPQLKPKRERVGRIVLADVSRATGNIREVADSVATFASSTSAAIVFDSIAHEVDPTKLADTLGAVAGQTNRSTSRGSLSSALITGLRAAARVREAADSLELVVVSPFVGEERDAATDSIRALWPGHVRLVKVAAANLAADTGAAAAPSARVEWADSVAAGAPNTFWTARAKPDTIGAVRAGDAVLIYPFVRKWQPAITTDSVTRVYARWADGEPAAFERRSGTSCVRTVAFSLPTAGDVSLRPDFVRFVDELSSPCGVTRNVAPLSPDFLASFEGSKTLAPVTAIKPRETRMTPLVPWLLGAALVLALVELLVRRISGGNAGAAAELAETPKARTSTGVAA